MEAWELLDSFDREKDTVQAFARSIRIKMTSDLDDRDRKLTGALKS